MKRILLFMPYGSVGGMERLALTFYNYYKEKNYHVKALKIIKLDNDIVNFPGDEYFVSSKDLHNYSFLSRLLLYLKVFHELKKIIIREKITHCISFGDMANMFNSLTSTTEIKIGSIHAIKSLELGKLTFLNLLTKILYRTSYKNFHKTVCISKAIENDILENCNYKFKDNIKIIYNPHKLNDIIKSSELPLKNFKEEQLFNFKVILFVGRLSVQKANWHLINSFRLLSDKHPDARLVFIGDGDKQILNILKHLAGHNNLNEKVYFFGRKDNPYQFLKRASVLSLTSFYEGTPNVIVEAISLGIPVVTSYFDGVLELMSLDKNIKNDNQIMEVEAGLITPSFNDGSLSIPDKFEITREEKIFANALEKAIYDQKYKNTLLINSSSLLEKFNHEKVAEEYIN